MIYNFGDEELLAITEGLRLLKISSEEKGVYLGSDYDTSIPVKEIVESDAMDISLIDSLLNKIRSGIVT